jgi:two-component system, chemotaxis family, CheB/CheR fusion protein
MTEHSSLSLRVLLVDDCADVRTAVGTLLRLWGHGVRTVVDGPSCLDAVEEYQPHVVLLDVGLPGMDGFEVARRLRAHPPAWPLRLVTISGYGMEEDFQRSRVVGCDRHMVKPVDLLDLRHLLKCYAELMRRELEQEAQVS